MSTTYLIHIDTSKKEAEAEALVIAKVLAKTAGADAASKVFGSIGIATATVRFDAQLVHKEEGPWGIKRRKVLFKYF